VGCKGEKIVVNINNVKKKPKRWSPLMRAAVLWGMRQGRRRGSRSAGCRGPGQRDGGGGGEKGGGRWRTPLLLAAAGLVVHSRMLCHWVPDDGGEIHVGVLNQFVFEFVIHVREKEVKHLLKQCGRKLPQLMHLEVWHRDAGA